MKIAFFEIEDWEKKYLKEKFRSHNLFFSKDNLDEKNIASVRDADILCVFIYSKINRQILKKFKKLKTIVTRSTGFEHIDIKECKKRKIQVLNVPFYGENTVAEHTFALILNLSRKIHNACERTKKGDFSLEGLRGFDLKGKTLGIIGLGHIGIHVARIAKGFEMNLLVYTPHKNRKLGKRLGIKYVSLDNLLKNSDIVTLHSPYNKQTHHMINSKNIKLMKKGAYLINTARGGLIDTRALIKSLKKDLGGAALDVLEEEELIKEEAQMLSRRFSREDLESLFENHILMSFDNVVITPHNAFNSKEALQRILDTTIDNLMCIIKKKRCGNLVQ
ncbi:D-lactate dehydrogenase [archaeon BMS3Abin17]|nr:D-lactate dehydrogenase [archaeon BMS3Abin17]HDZ61325.1 hydroxyacid dehydrogenase [Candidatus Pacearchaeota archaeon]